MANGYEVITKDAPGAEDFMQLNNNTIIKLLVPFDRSDYNEIDTSIRKHNSHSLKEYIEYFNIPLMCFGTNEKCQRYYCIDCIITSAPIVKTQLLEQSVIMTC